MVVSKLALTPRTVDSARGVSWRRKKAISRG